MRPARDTEADAMRYTLYEHPLTGLFALIPLPARYLDGDALPLDEAGGWFGSHAEAVAAVPGLLHRDEERPAAPATEDDAQPR